MSIAEKQKFDWIGWLEEIAIPILAVITALALGALIILSVGGNPLVAYKGLIDGAFLKKRAFTETLVATTPYIFLGLAVAFGFKCGLFNIGAEGQFYIGEIAAVWVGYNFAGLPAYIHLPAALAAGILAGAIWSAIPGYLRGAFGAHEVITTIMMNYVAIYLADYLVGMKGPMRDPKASVPQTKPIAPSAAIPRLNELPAIMQNPMVRLGWGLVFAVSTYLLLKWWLGKKMKGQRLTIVSAVAGLAIGVFMFIGLAHLKALGGPFTDPADRLHLGFFLALLVAVFIWWLLNKTTIGFEVRTVGANPDAAEYAGISIIKNFVLAMGISGGLAGLAGSVEVLGLERMLKSFFSAGYGFDSIAVALLAKNDPFGIIASAFLFGSLRNGADLMELRSGISKHVIGMVQALVLLFVAAPIIIRWIYRIRARKEEKMVITRGWGK